MHWVSLRRLIAATALLAVAACSGGGGGGGGGSTTPTATTVAPPLTNFTTLVIDGGPAALATGAKGYVSDDIAFVTITLCAPGSTTNCQTIDHVVVDTGSVGLRIPAGILSAGLLGALPQPMDPGGNPVGECYGFVDGYAFGSVRTADFTIGGEKVAGMPVHVVGDGGRFAAVPAQCSAGGGHSLTTIQDFGGNGIIGIGVTATDCGAQCTTAGGYAAAIYYDCPAAGCGAIIARAATTTAPFEQLPNPVAAFAVDNNGTIVSLPSVPDAGAPTLTGTLYFGIGTQTNNALGSATVLTTASGGSGLVTVVYKAANLTNSFIDSGSNGLFFVDTSVTPCTGTSLAGYYCPPSPLSLALTIQGRNGASATVTQPLYNARTLLTGNNTALPGIGANPNATANFDSLPRSFDLGLPFFFGRNVYVAIDGRPAGGTIGPYFAF